MQMSLNHDDSSDMDEPMASQSADSEAPLTHNSSKNNFFPLSGSASGDEQQGMLMSTGTGAPARGSFKVCQTHFCHRDTPFDGQIPFRTES